MPTTFNVLYLYTESFTFNSHSFNNSNIILLSVLYSIWQYRFLIPTFTPCLDEPVVAYCRPPPPPITVYLLNSTSAAFTTPVFGGEGGDTLTPYLLLGAVPIYFSGTVHTLSTGSSILRNLNFPSKLFLTTSQSILNSLSIGILFPCLCKYIQYLVQ